MSNKFCIFKRAAIIYAALFFHFTSTATAKNESASDIIDKAQTLALQKERTQASQLLVNAIKKETKRNPKAVKEMQQALENIAINFLSDKAQQLYELGVSLRFTDPKTALQKISESSKLEPDNLTIQLELSRIMMSLGDCANANDALKKMKELYPFSEGLDLAMSQAALCLGNFEIYKSQRSHSEDKKSPFYSYWLLVELEYQFKIGHFARAKEISKQMQSDFSTLPEPYFWEWKISGEENLKADIAANKYISLCKSISSRAAREYGIEPMLCRRVSEVETYLKKNGGQGV